MRPFEDTLRAWVKEGIVSPEMETKLHTIQDAFIKQSQIIKTAWESERQIFNPYEDEEVGKARQEYEREIVAEVGQAIARSSPIDPGTRQSYRRIIARDTELSGSDIRRAKEVPFKKVFSHEAFKIRFNKTHCPFHKEKTASFGYSPRTNVAKCFGCDWSGDTIKFVKEKRMVSFREAVQYLLSL